MQGENVFQDNDAQVVQRIEMTQLDAGPAGGQSVAHNSLDLIKNVKVCLMVSLGSCEMTVKELFELKDRSIVKLDRETHEPVDVMVDGKVIARGELVAVEDNFGVRITEILTA